MEKKEIVFFTVVIILGAIVAYVETGGFNLNRVSPLTTSTTTVAPNTTSTTTIAYIAQCQSFYSYTSANGTNITEQCTWNGGTLGLWVASGNTGSEHVTIVGSDNKTYVNQTSSYQCTTFYQNFTAPAQSYRITLQSGPGVSPANSLCTYAIAKLNTTVIATDQNYSTLLNGNFSTGTYSGWAITGAGFGPAPLGVTYANSNTMCYLGQPWSGYNGTYFATTYNCGSSNAPGNLTSLPFVASEPFLNFRIVSPYNKLLYVQVLYANYTPAISAHYDTYNITLGGNASTTFRNASIPLVSVLNKRIRIRVVASTLNPQNYIAVGGFGLGSRPIQDKGIQYGPYNMSG